MRKVRRTKNKNMTPTFIRPPPLSFSYSSTSSTLLILLPSLSTSPYSPSPSSSYISTTSTSFSLLLLPFLFPSSVQKLPVSWSRFSMTWGTKPTLDHWVSSWSLQVNNETDQPERNHLDPGRCCATGLWRSCWSRPSSCCGTSWWSWHTNVKQL